MAQQHVAHRTLVTGASGTVGSALAAALRARGTPFATMSSRPGAATVHGDWRDAASLRRGFEGVGTLFLLLPLVPDKLALARHAVHAARAAGVRHVVRLSSIGADVASPLSIGRLQGEIDALVAASGIAWTLLRPNAFMQNLVGFAADAIRAGRFAAPHGDGATSWIDARDIAACAAAVLADPAAHAACTYELTGARAWTDGETMALIAKAVGRDVRYVDVPEDATRRVLAGAMPAPVVDWLMDLHHMTKHGWGAVVTDGVQRLTGREPHGLPEFVHEHAAAWR